jgi:oxygen-independent coproporphyrinogen III oxidase
VTPKALYVHVPFCTRRCSYCDFAVQAGREPPVGAWLDAVAEELRLQSEHAAWPHRPVLDTLYVGGGTPSLLGVGAIPSLGDRLSLHVDWDPARVEWTCEANPESFTLPLATDWRTAGVNRISLGMQTFHEPTLRWMGRLHGSDGPPRAVAAARRAGFDNLSLDLIFGLPAELGRDWSADLDGVLALAPEHVSLYGLTAEPATPLGRGVAEGRVALADEDRYAEEYLLAHARLTEAGFEHYEVSNFALPGFRSRHNQVYWSGAPYAALGPGAHGFAPPVRRWNTREWAAYREAVACGRLPIAGEESITEEDAELERSWLGLRTSDGYPLADATGPQREMAQLWVGRGWADVRGERVRLTAEGWLLLDRLALELAAAGSFT